MHNVAVMCASLDNFANGIITYANDTTPDYDFATTATYTCNDGYRLRVDHLAVVSYVYTCVSTHTSTGVWSRDPRYNQPRLIFECECKSSAISSVNLLDLEKYNHMQHGVIEASPAFAHSIYFITACKSPLVG